MSQPDPFYADARAIANYAERTARLVPGLRDPLHTMASLLVTERAPDTAQVLAVGAGGGMELKAMAQAHPAWRFVGVDPSRGGGAAAALNGMPA